MFGQYLYLPSAIPCRLLREQIAGTEGDHSSPKSDNFPTKVFLFPRNHIFTLKNDLRTFVEKCRKSQLRAIMG